MNSLSGKFTGDRGSATVLALALGAVIIGCGWVAISFVQMSIVRATLGSYADLSALAAAQASGDSCVQAAAIAALNGVELSGCADYGDAVRVRVTTPTPHFVRLLSGQGTLSVEAQASRAFIN